MEVKEEELCSFPISEKRKLNSLFIKEFSLFFLARGRKPQQ